MTMKHGETLSLALGLAGILTCAAGARAVPEILFPSYLFAFVFWLGISAGSLGLALLHGLAGGAWGIEFRRPLGAAMGALPLLALLFIPLFAGLEALYPWAGGGGVGSDELIRHKTPYLNVPFFTIRAVAYFAVWILLALGARRGIRGLAAPGMILYFLTVSFMAVDWMMSLEPRWFSTVYGLGIVVRQGLAASALATLVVAFPVWKLRASDPRLIDAGNLTFMFVLLWAYLSFAQYLIHWSGNLPEEIEWHLRRSRGGWRGMALSLMVFHFAVPFALLLSRRIKSSGTALSMVMAGLLVANGIDLLWLILPAAGRSSAHFAWTLPAALVGIGGLWWAVYLRALQRDPGSPEAAVHG